MQTVAEVAIHESQFPAQIRRDLLDSLARREVHHKFHYDSVKQTQKWLALHQAYSPSRTDPDCAATYDRAFDESTAVIRSKSVHLIGLGCGGGQKDARLLALLKRLGKSVAYTPCDVSVAMVLTARDAVTTVVPAKDCFPFVCDFQATSAFKALADRENSRAEARLITFFGMLPNFEPDRVTPDLRHLLRTPADRLLLSANLAPGNDYEEGIRQVLPLYDNPPTRDWLITFLLDLGVEHQDGSIRFSVESDRMGLGLRRIEARFVFDRERRILVGEHSFEYAPGDAIRLFFSYRHTPALVGKVMARHGLKVAAQWLTESGEEGVFLVEKV